MHIYKQAGFLPQWSIICIGKYRSDEMCTSSLNTRALIYISLCEYIHIFMFMLLIVIVMVIVTLSTLAKCAL